MTERVRHRPTWRERQAIRRAREKKRARGCDREELLSALNELLEAERAGAQVTLRTARQMSNKGLEPLVMAIHRDEARWCAMLITAIRRLRGVPSRKIGAFQDKAMAIDDIASRLAFLNRGQAWVVRKLEELLPSVRGDDIHTELEAMLVSHERNIGLVSARLPSMTKPS